jgi:malonate-semialdehyde dehydrogenase (acetylating)/methylmalonate-semialdehyde dehydrogenase
MTLRFGISPIGWSNDDMPELGGETPLEQCLAEARQAGYVGVELGNKFPRQSEALREVLRQHRLCLASGWYGAELVRRTVEEEIEALQDHLKLLSDLGCTAMVFADVTGSVQGQRDKSLAERPRLADDEWAAFGERLTKVGDYLKAQGIQLAYHHHMGTVVETEEEIDRLMAHTGPSVGLLVDTGHVTFAGGDPVAVIERHRDRLVYVHCKDVRPRVMEDARRHQWSFLDAVLRGVFTVPGDGSIDYRGVITALKAAKYDGWIVVEAEQDPALAPPLAYATKGYRHIAHLVNEVGLYHEIPYFVNGQRVEGKTERYGEVYNPATGEKIAKVPLARAAEVEEVIEAAAAAAPGWAAMPPLRRARIITNFRQLLEDNQEVLTSLVSTQHGKVYEDAQGEVIRAIEVAEFAAGAPHLLKGEISEDVGSDIDSYGLRQPLGVVAGITPFNFPAMVPMWMAPVAIACGNTFVLKPSERDPSPAIMLAELWREAGLPDGVFNVVHGDKEAVDVLLTHPKVKAVSFVGSTPVARHVYSTGAAHGKRVQALGGAKNHMVIMPDADMDKAVDALMGAAYGSAGERCMAIAVAVPVGEGTAEALLEKLVPRLQALRVGPGCDRSSEMGPLVTPEHWARVKGYVDLGEQEGATLVVDGRTFTMDQPGYEKGFFLGGTLFDHVKPEMRIYLEEIFGPVLCMVRVPDYRAAVELIHGHEYGNGVALFTRDGETARNFVNEIQVGMVGINVPIPVPMAFHSFGGWKNSLFGDHHMHGPEGVRFYTRLKTVTSRWFSGIQSGATFVMPTMK